MAQTVDIIVRATTSGASAALGVLMQTLESVYNDVKKIVDEYSNYATAIGKAAELTGVTAEEMSRLVQAADDVFVSQENLTRGFQLALKNGFVPTIENLANLSDKLLAIENPSERAAKASKIFGRNWAELAPFLLQGGDAIRDGTAAIEDGLVVTDDAVAKNIEYKQSVDEVNDNIQALSYSAAKVLIPALTNVIDSFNVLISSSGTLNDILKDHENRTATTAKSYKEYTAEIQRSIQATGISAVVTNGKIKTYGMLSIQQRGIIDGLRVMTEQEWLTRASAIESDRALLGMATNLESNVIPAFQHVKVPMEEFEAMAKTISDTQERLRDHAEEVARKVAAEGDALRNNLANAVDALATAQQNWNSGAGNDFKSALEGQGLKGKDLVDALALIDSTMGTSLAQQETYRLKVEEIAKEYAQGKLDGDDFKRAIKDIQSEFQPLDDQVLKAKDALLKLREQWEYFKANNQINLTITYAIPGQIPVYVPPQAYGPGGGGGSTPPSTGSGGGGGGGGGGGYTPTSVTIQNNSPVDASRVAAQIAQAIQRRR
jgi:hypothetical protein